MIFTPKSGFVAALKNGLVLLAATLLLFAASTLVPTSADAAPSPESRAVINFGDVYCELAVHDVHTSMTGDVSSHSTAHCYSSKRGGARQKVQSISMTSRFLYFDPLLINSERFEPKQGTSKPNFDRYELPYHVPWRGPGVYTATTEARVTYAGRVLSATANNMQILEAPTAWA